MSCDNFRQVHAYHDGELPQAERAAVEAHLRGCPDCAALLSDLQQMSHLVAAAPLAEMPQAAMHRLEQSFWAARARDRGVLRLAEWMTGVAAAVLIGAAVFWHGGATTQNAQHASLQSLALMPPGETRSDDASPSNDVVVLAEWMANDLSPRQGGNNP